MPTTSGRMEDVIQTYQRPYDPKFPVVCFDEACKQLFGEVRPAAAAAVAAQVDYEYEPQGCLPPVADV